MSDRKRNPRYHASARGSFTESGAWLIAPRVWFRDDLSTSERDALGGGAHEELLGKILDEALRGKRLGADRVQVALEDGGRVTVVDKDEPPPKTGS